MREQTLRKPAGGPVAERDQFGLDLPFRQLLEALPVGAYTCDRDGLITYYNKPAAELWGRAPKLNDPADRWCGSFKLYSVEGVPLTHDQCWMALAIKTGVPQTACEIIVERPDGQRIVALAHANPLRDARGELIGAVNVLVDIDDRKRASVTQSRLGAIVESSDDAIISKTLDGRIVSWNAGAERLFGYSADEAVGQPITLIIPPDRRNEEREILARLTRGERVEHVETVRMSKSGRLLNVSLTTSPVRDASGRVVGASKVARDVTGKKRDEEALARLQEMSLRLSTALDFEFILSETARTAAAILGTYSSLIFLADAKGEYLEIGASFGLQPELLAKVPRIKSGEGGAGRCFAERRRIIVEDVETDASMENYRDIVRQMGFRATYNTPLITRGGTVLGVLSCQFTEPYQPIDRERSLIDLCARQAVDFIENARLYDELREADRAKNDFLATLAHELRNPLAPIRNTVETLHLTESASPDLRSALGVIERQMAQMTRLIDDLLDVSRITKNKLELRRDRIDLAEVLHAAVESSRPLLTARSHDFGVDLPPEPILLDADLTRLAQVVANLLNNAAKYTERGGRIRLTAQRQGNEALITVRDSGIGIPAEMQDRIFEMFTQVGRSLDRSQGGLGIGLTLAKRLVEMHGGSISVSSDGPGKGSTFTLQLPTVSGASSSRQRSGRDSVRLTPASSLRILVVDDNRDSADSLGTLLAIPGNEVHIAYDGLHAIEVASEFRPDVVLLDIGLPKLNGYETAQRIRELPWGKGTTLIALTGWGQDEAKQRSKEAGFDAHLVKPVDPAVLMRELTYLKPRSEA